jgi:hypothetical protein
VLSGNLFRSAPGQGVDRLLQLGGAEASADEPAKRTGAAAGGQRRLRPRLLDLGQQASHLGAGRPHLGSTAGGAEEATREPKRSGVDRIHPVGVCGGEPERDLGRAPADIADGDQGRQLIGRRDRAQIGQPPFALGRQHARGDPGGVCQRGKQGAGVRALTSGRGHHHLEPVTADLARQLRVGARALSRLGELGVRDPATPFDHVAEPNLVPLLAE